MRLYFCAIVLRLSIGRVRVVSTRCSSVVWRVCSLGHDVVVLDTVDRSTADTFVNVHLKVASVASQVLSRLCSNEKKSSEGHHVVSKKLQSLP